MKYISDDKYNKALGVFTELLNDDVYDSEDIDAIKKFEDALDLCLAYEQQCYSKQKIINESLISAFQVNRPKRTAFSIKDIF